MCRSATNWVILLALAVPALTQGPARQVNPDWRRIGNSALEIDLAGLATGPVDRVWYSADGGRLFVGTSQGRVYETTDFEAWRLPQDVPLAPSATGLVDKLPDGAVLARGPNRLSLRQYAIGAQVWRTEDGGRAWRNLTAWKGKSILGSDIRDIAVSPKDEDELVVAGASGIWRSLDGGKSWSGLNDLLPNLPVRKLAALARDTNGVRISLAGAEDVEFEWAPGEKRAWRKVPPEQTAQQAAVRARLSASLGAAVTAYAAAGPYFYAGDQRGRLWVSVNAGIEWSDPLETEGGTVEAIFVDAREPRVALASFDANPSQSGSPRLLRTLTGGGFWDDLTADLPPGGAHGVAADLETGAIYLATDRGVYWTYGNLSAAGPATAWTLLSSSLPAAPAVDLTLDPAGNQLYVAVSGFGVYAAMAPHRLRSPRVVSAADLTARPAAPGALLSVLGAKVDAARAGQVRAPVLAQSDAESQIQIPFEASGDSVALSLEGQGRVLTLGLPLGRVAPAVFADRDGTPMILDADSGILLDAMNPARSGTRIQILATGLGKVRPDWPTGLAAPLDSPPQVIASVRVQLDRVPLEVTRATLAPGYIGFYLVEVSLPSVVNSGPAELFIEAGGAESNRVRLYLEP